MSTGNVSPVDWSLLEQLANEASMSGVGLGEISESRWHLVSQTLHLLSQAQQKEDVIRLRRTFNSLYARDTAWGLQELRELDEAAILAAREMNAKYELASLLGARGHNLHREGRHREAIEAFSEASDVYRGQGASFESTKSFFMTALCYRALGQRQKALDVLEQVLALIEKDDPWRGQPLQVTAWLVQDAGDLKRTEELLREAIKLHKHTQDPDILVAGTLADLAEVVGFQKRPEEATELFQESLGLLDKHARQYDRQEARTRLKFAEFLQGQGQLQEALTQLDIADDLISRYGHYYDLLWRIELTRSLVFFKQKRFGAMLRKVRSVLHYRRQLGLSRLLLIRQVVQRTIAGTGLPR